MLRFFYLIFLIPLFLKGQVNENNKLPMLNPTSPKAFEFLKYGEIPISKYTGVPNISVPIYTIEAKGLSIPLVLSYNSGGFRVNEEAGWTGLGWSISGGGAIIQIVNGFDDFGAPYNNRNLPDLAEIFDIKGTPLSGETIMNNCNVTLLESHGKYNNQPRYLAGHAGYYYIPVELFSGTKDFEPDIFKFNMPGYSGEFLLDWENEVFICLTDNKIRIEPQNYNGMGNVPTSFAITVPEGHKFTFTLKEQTTINTNLSLSDIFPGGSTGNIDMAGKTTSRSYQLTTIITNQGDRIDYDYTLTNPIKNLPSISKSVTRYISVSDGFHQPFPNHMSDDLTSFYYSQQSYSYISKITFNNGVLLFGLSDRSDQIGAKKLDQIQLKRSQTSSNIIKEINFNYSYFNGHTNGTNEDQYLDYGTGVVKNSGELTTRLKLNSCQVTGEPPYLFEYNTEQLPKKTSLASDYWGFYNGVLTNQNSFPNLYALNQERGNPLFNSYEANNKGSSLQHTKAAILQKIIYPTKGYTVFDYELNSFDNTTSKISPFEAYGNFTASVNSRLINGLPSLRSILVENDGTVFSGGAMLSTRGCTASDLANGANDDIYIKIQVFKKELIDYVVMQPNYESYGLQFVLGTQGFIDGTHPLYNTYIDEVIYLQKDANEQEKIFSNLSYTFNRSIVVFSAHGGCGTYNGTVNSSQAGLNLTYKAYAPIEDIAYGGGLRIKSISSFDFNGNLAFKKRYDYFGGRKMDALMFYNTMYIFNYDWLDNQGGPEGMYKHSAGTKKTFSSNSFISPSGHLIGYDRVDEVTISNQNNSITNGKISDFYINNPNAGILPSMNMSAVKNVDNGFQYKQEVFDSNGVLKKRITNAYTLNKLKCFYGLKQNLTAIQSEAIANAIYFWYVYDVGLKPYTVTTISNVNSSTTSYFSETMIEETKEYQYNDFNQVIYSKETNSDGDIAETFLAYPIDLQATNSVASEMVNSNVIAPVLKKQVKLNGELTSTQQYNYYKRLGSNNNFLLPDVYSLSKTQSAKSTNTLADDVIYYQYDNLGNLQEIRLPGGTKVTYIWGYGGKYPVAKIENASYVDFNIYISNLQALSNADNDRTLNYLGTEGALRSALDNLRSQPAFANTLITTYTYDPLIGVTSITDPKGFTVYYDYDAQSRLLYIKDNQGNILTKNTYHYKN